MLYNEKRKMTYIELAKDRNVQLEKIMIKRFSDSYDKEKSLNKDICEWTSSEIIDFYQSKVLTSLESLIVMHGQYHDYARWCLNNHMIADNQNHFSEIDREILNEKCVNIGFLMAGIVTRKELLNLLQKCEQQGSIQNAYEQFLILGFFEGIGGKNYSDFRDLDMSCIHGDSIQLPNRTLKISPELIHYAQKAADEYVYYPYGNLIEEQPFNADDKRIIKDRPILRNPTSLPAYRHRLAVNLNRIAANCDSPVFSANMLAESGRLQMIKDLMRKDGTDALTTIMKYKKEIAYRYGNIHAVARYIDKWDKFLQVDKDIE